MTMASDGREVVLTHTAKSKAFRYYDQRQVEAAIAGHDGPVFFDTDRGTWLIKTRRYETGAKLNHEKEQTIVLIVDTDGDTLVVVTQTGDHYDWSQYARVGAIGETPSGWRENNGE